MKKTEICRKTACLGEQGIRTIVYAVTEEEDETEFPIKQYGVSVAVYENDEETEVNSLASKREEIERFVLSLARNFVTPVSLKDVVYDWLSAV